MAGGMLDPTERGVAAGSQRADLLAARAEAATAEAEQAVRLAVSALAEADDLRRALQTRGTIDMAKGIIIAVQSVDPETAFDILRKASQRSHVKLVDVAAKIVDAAITRTLTAQPWAAGADSTDESTPCTDRACCCGPPPLPQRPIGSGTKLDPGLPSAASV